MSKTLIISDIHQRHVKVQKLLETVEYDTCIFLGDYWDDFGDFPENARQTALWLRDVVLPNKNITPLIGNHCIAYFHSYNERTRCSGFSIPKRDAIFSVLNRDHIDQFKWYHEQDGFLFSHAGIGNLLFKEMQLSKPEDRSIATLLPEFIAKSVHNLTVCQPAPLFEAGYDRGGGQLYGGILWGDWGSFTPIKGVNQIVGHTPHNVPEVFVQLTEGKLKRLNIFEFEWNRAKYKNDITSLNYALDTHNEHYMTIDDGVVTIWDWKTHEPVRGSESIHTVSGKPFVPATDLHDPELGYFQFANDGDSVEMTGVEYCICHNTAPSQSNLVYFLQSAVSSGIAVTFLRPHKFEDGSRVNFGKELWNVNSKKRDSKWKDVSGHGPRIDRLDPN